jgi:hypothetical protein
MKRNVSQIASAPGGATGTMNECSAAILIQCMLTSIFMLVREIKQVAVMVTLLDLYLGGAHFEFWLGH